LKSEFVFPLEFYSYYISNNLNKQGEGTNKREAEVYQTVLCQIHQMK